MADNILLAYAEPLAGNVLAGSTSRGIVYLGERENLIWMPNGEITLFSTSDGSDKKNVAFVSKLYTSTPQLQTISSLLSPVSVTSLNAWLRGLLVNIQRRFSNVLNADLELAIYPISGNVSRRPVIGENVRFTFSYKDASGKQYDGLSNWLANGGMAVAFTLMLWGDPTNGGRAYALLTHYIPDGENAQDMLDAVPIPTPAWANDKWSAAYVVLMYRRPANASAISINAEDFGIPESVMMQRRPPNANTYRIGLKPTGTIQNIAARDVTADGSRAVTIEYETEKLVLWGEAQYALTVCEPGDPCLNAFVL